VLDSPKRAPDVHGQHSIQLFRRHPFDILSDVHAGIIDENVQPSEAVLYGPEDTFPTVLRTHVQQQELRPIETIDQGVDLGGRAPAFFLLGIANKNKSSFLLEALRDSGTETLGCAGDERNFVSKPHCSHSLA